MTEHQPREREAPCKVQGCGKPTMAWDLVCDRDHPVPFPVGRVRLSFRARP